MGYKNNISENKLKDGSNSIPNCPDLSRFVPIGGDGLVTFVTFLSLK